MRTRLYKVGSNQYARKPKAPIRAIMLTAPFVITIVLIIHACLFFIRSFKQMSNPLIYVVILTLIITLHAQAEAPRGSLTHPFVPKATPIPLTEKQLIFTYTHGDIMYRLWGLESTFGTHPFLYCTKRRELNDMGYNVLNHQCFPTLRSELQTVNNWIESHSSLPLGELLCLYNTGIPEGCEYQKNFLKL